MCSLCAICGRLPKQGKGVIMRNPFVDHLVAHSCYGVPDPTTMLAAPILVAGVQVLVVLTHADTPPGPRSAKLPPEPTTWLGVPILVVSVQILVVLSHADAPPELRAAKLPPEPTT